MLLPVPPYSISAYIIMQFCHFSGMPSFVSGPLFLFASLQQAYKLPGRKCARPCRSAAGAGHCHVPGGSTPVLAAGAGSSQLPAPLVPATAISSGAARPSLPPAATSFQRRRRRPASSAACASHCHIRGGSVGNYPTRSLDCASSSDYNSDTRPDHQVLDRGAMAPQTTADMLSPVHAQSCSHVVPLS